MIGIVDYGMGNLRSVQKGFEKIGTTARICTTPDEVAAADKVVLPGVGAFRDAINELKKQDLIQPILQHIEKDKPFLGICLGLQLLMDVSYEDGEWEGLKVVPGQVVRFQDQPGLKIPHMGWNCLETVGDSPLFAGIPEGSYFYFVHSYYVAPTDDGVVAAWTEHGTRFVSAIRRGNMFATQFHPEKSQKYGLQILGNFAAL